MVGMNTPLIATLDGQGRLSKYAAGMAACAAALQALAMIVQAIGGTWSVGQWASERIRRQSGTCVAAPRNSARHTRTRTGRTRRGISRPANYDVILVYEDVITL